MNATIRPVRRADYDEWISLWDAYNVFYGRSGPTALDRAITDMTWNRFFDSYEAMHAFVAEVDGRLVGVAHFLLHRSTTAIAPSCYLQDLFTSLAARRRGIGRSLIEAVYLWAQSHGCGRVYWQTHESNAPAQALYDSLAERSGFIVYRKVLSPS